MIISNLIAMLKRIPNQNAETLCRDEKGICYEVYKIEFVDGKPYFHIREKGQK